MQNTTVNILLITLVVMVFITLIVFFVSKILNDKSQEEETKRRSQFDVELEKFLQLHSKTLIKTFRQSVFQDKYGNLVFDRWDTELDYFIETVLKTRMQNFTEEFLSLRMLRDRITDVVAKKSQSTPLETINVDKISPQDFEIYCLEILESSGWKGHLTKKSGDQGIDIVAQYKELLFVFQCKLYSQPIGNKAVQEVLAGREFESADFGAVIANQDYTESAKILAKNTSILLLHYSDLAELGKNLENAGLV